MTRPRIDPRASRTEQRVASGENGRRRYDLSSRTASNPIGPPRRDPRQEWAASLIDRPGRRRYDRSQRPVARGGASNVEAARVGSAAEAVSTEPTVRIIEEPAFLVFAFVDAPGGRLSRFDRQVLGGARLLADAGGGGGAVVAIVAEEIDGLGAAGADRVMSLPTNGSASARAAALRAAIETHAPRHVLFAEDGDAADCARRLSVALGEPLFSNVEHLTARQVVRPNRGRRAELAAAPPRLMTLGEDRAKMHAGAPGEARPLEFETAPSDDQAILSVEIIPGDPARLALSETDFVVSAGNGVTDFEGFRELAALMKGTPGASRVVCDAGLMPRGAQVGASGTVLAADCYFALGISGAPQHLQGIAACEQVIAVNTDLHAAMIERAGLAIVQDAQLVMPALIKLLKERQS
ncbi:electron transfer flavoprotein subunit alpha/FixB family protein [Jiella marina]|uniref:electron transfer flavoprotein subunit alpha/FixB family protein n=1 Tax=Jiella sp. LLJ827 TaxID=2917712 RepID=UPI002101C786|nr:electron transfer flavoprotein subunit alpha/FixB family protein [Jiella sp. LLJ827]MCQ0986669.1 electron transfer flavoprotein subunit alpha/FixB family protein [Jiella sp. LLJ827]